MKTRLPWILLLAPIVTWSAPVQYQRTCGPLSSVMQAQSVEVEVNALNACDRSDLHEDEAQLKAQLVQAIRKRITKLRIRDDGADLIIIFTVLKDGPNCVSPTWDWNAAIDTWLPLPNDPGTVAFVQIAEVMDSASSRENFASDFAESLLAIRAGRAPFPPAEIKCRDGLNAKP